MTHPPSLMSVEARQAASVVRAQLANNRSLCEELAKRCAARPPRLISTCARGSSDHAATYAKYLIETRVGVPVLSAAPSIGALYDAPVDLKDTLMLCVSQSGQSPDLIENAKWAKRRGALVVSMLNTEDSPLAEVSDFVLPVGAGKESSIAATKSYIGSLSAMLQLAAHLAPSAAGKELLDACDALPDQLEKAAELDWSAAAEPLAQCADALVVGRGLSFGIAQEAALKLKETCGLHAEAFSSAELMHGPLALIRDQYPVLLFSQRDQTRAGVIELVETLRGKGARVFAADIPGPDALPVVEGQSAVTAPICQVQTYYGLVDQVARLRGLDPDNPPHLRKQTLTR